MKTKKCALYRACATALAIGAAAITLLPAATHAGQVVVWSQNFDAEPLGPYGTTENFGTQPTNTIVAPGMGGTGQAMEITFDAVNGSNINFQVQTLRYPASGNTNAILANYTLEFDMAIQGATPGYNMEISVEGPDGTTFGGHVSRWTVGTPTLPNAGAGYVHITLPLSNSVAGNSGTPLDPTAGTFRIAFGALAFPTAIDATPETIDVDNIQIAMNTNPPPIPPPIMNIVRAKPGLRIFEQNSGATYNQEGIATVDNNQSWLGSTPANPTTYKITISSFASVANSALHIQFVQTAAINPYIVFANANAMDWRIRRDTSGFFSQRISWKTNLINSGTLANVAVNNVTNTSTTGVGTWTLTFTNDTDGTLTAPDGSTNSFSLPSDMVALFANPVTIGIGTTPGSAAGYGQFFDISRISITNSVWVDHDDFTLDNTLDTALWSPAFSLDAGSVFLVSTNTPYWVTWTVPDDGFGLATKASLTGGTNVWFSPNYYGGGTATNSTPTKMGTTLKWTLIPKECLPTVDGLPGGPVSPTGFFRLSNPPPAQ